VHHSSRLPLPFRLTLPFAFTIPLPIFSPTGSSRGYEVLSSDDDVVNCMIWNALNAAVPSAYTPPCNGLMLVVIIPCHDNGTVAAQINVASIPVAALPATCSCSVSGFPFHVVVQHLRAGVVEIPDYLLMLW